MDSQPSADVLRPVAEMPPQVRDAAYLLWGSLGLGIVNFALHWNYVSTQGPVAFIIIAGLGAIALWSWLTLKTIRGRNWARITVLILTLVGLPSLLRSVLELLRDPALSEALGSLTQLMQIAAVWLVFTDPGRAWFRSSEPG